MDIKNGWRVMDNMEKLKPCPFCGSAMEHRQTNLIDGFCCRKPECGAVVTFAGFDGNGPVDSFKAFNIRTQPDPKALTLEEFESFCKPQPNKIYKPLWIKTLHDNKISCALSDGLIKGDHRHKPPKRWIDCHRWNMLITDYGKTWLAYDHEPRKDKKNEMD